MSNIIQSLDDARVWMPVDLIDVVISDASDVDLFGGMWVAYKHLGNKARYIGGNSLGRMPTNMNVLVIGCIPPGRVLEALSDGGCRILVLLNGAGDFASLDDLKCLRILESEEPSASMLAWTYFKYAQDPPLLIRHIGDYITGKMSMLDTREIVASLQVEKRSFPAWDRAEMEGYGDLCADGSAILRFQDSLVGRLRSNSSKITLTDSDVSYIAVNAPVHQREVAGRLLEDNPDSMMVVCYHHVMSGTVNIEIFCRSTSDLMAMADAAGGSVIGNKVVLPLRGEDWSSEISLAVKYVRGKKRRSA